MVVQAILDGALVPGDVDIENKAWLIRNFMIPAIFDLKVSSHDAAKNVPYNRLFDLFQLIYIRQGELFVMLSCFVPLAI